MSGGLERSNLCLFVGVDIILLFIKLEVFFADKQLNLFGVDDSGMVAIASDMEFDELV